MKLWNDAGMIAMLAALAICVSALGFQAAPLATTKQDHVVDINKKVEHSQTAKSPDDSKRSPKWPAVRAMHLKANPTCAACGENDRKILNVHHIVPFHVDHSKELETTNLITLCEGPVVNCHLLFGHLRNWKSHNVDVRKDAAIWREKIKNRPMPKATK